MDQDINNLKSEIVESNEFSAEIVPTDELDNQNVVKVDKMDLLDHTVFVQESKLVSNNQEGEPVTDPLEGTNETVTDLTTQVQMSCFIAMNLLLDDSSESDDDFLIMSSLLLSKMKRNKKKKRSSSRRKPIKF